VGFAGATELHAASVKKAALIVVDEWRAAENPVKRMTFSWSRLAGTTPRDLYEATATVKPL
jgi:hypothetical protein